MEMINHQLSATLDSLQRNTISLIFITFSLLMASFAEYEINFAGIQIDREIVFYFAIALIIFSYWNVWRLGSNLETLVYMHKGNTFELKTILCFHNWILNPFGKIKSNKHKISDCLPISLFIVYSSIVPKKAITRLFNHTDALPLLSKFLPYWIKLLVIYFLALIPVFFAFTLFYYLYRINEKTSTKSKAFLITSILLIVVLTLIFIPIENYIGLDFNQ